MCEMCYCLLNFSISLWSRFSYFCLADFMINDLNVARPPKLIAYTTADARSPQYIKYIQNVQFRTPEMDPPTRRSSSALPRISARTVRYADASRSSLAAFH